MLNIEATQYNEGIMFEDDEFVDNMDGSFDDRFTDGLDDRDDFYDEWVG